jgi:hypothetical protein
MPLTQFSSVAALGLALLSILYHANVKEEGHSQQELTLLPMHYDFSQF